MVRCESLRVLSGSRRAARKPGQIRRKERRKEIKMSFVDVLWWLAFFTATIWVSLIYLALKRKFSPKDQFEDTFGFRPGNFADTEVEQIVVDAKLRKLAQEFSDSAARENGFRLVSPSIVLSDDGSVLMEWRRDYKRAKKEVAKKKSNFWNAHTLADKFGYTVRKRYTDYTLRSANLFNRY